MLPSTRRESKGFFAENKANRGRVFLLSEEILKVSPHYKSYPLFDDTLRLSEAYPQLVS